MTAFFIDPQDQHEELGRLPHEFGSGRGVDGLTAAGTGVRTRVEDGPSWTVDLSRVESIGEIAVYAGSRRPASGDTPAQRRPVVIEGSADGEHWASLAAADELGPGVLRLPLEAATAARYVRVRALGECSLELDEVEVYGPNP